MPVSDEYAKYFSDFPLHNSTGYFLPFNSIFFRMDVRKSMPQAREVRQSPTYKEPMASEISCFFLEAQDQNSSSARVGGKLSFSVDRLCSFHETRADILN